MVGAGRFFLSHPYFLTDSASIEGGKNCGLLKFVQDEQRPGLRLRFPKVELRDATLKSPFSGKITNLNAKAFDHAKPGEVFCTIIDDSRFEVVFKVIESEVLSIAVGKQVQVLVPSNGVSL
ncbi:MAG: HlyD family efflux transporter periplasmic adaptor subunit [Cyclobacteriaceae bacterium]|nr:HlyD family efflux transporter periplasmic adaptor subunit [Cyclobacteriaceae bacterium]